MIDYEFLDKNIKFINKTDKIINIRTVGIINGTNIADSNYNKFTLKSFSWFIPEVSFMGYSSLEVYVDEKYHYRIVLPSFLTKHNKFKPKIICIGLNKTGTTSFRDSLVKCGLKEFNEHFGHQYLLADIENGNIHSTLSFLEYPKYDFYEDMPFSLLNVYKTIYKYRPQDYYVLTIRDNVEQWVESTYKYYFNDLDEIHINRDRKPYEIYYHGQDRKTNIRNYLTAQMRNWGIKSKHNFREKLKDIYNKHLDDVTDFFNSNLESNFIMINVGKENELRRLSNFVGIDTNDSNFLWSNKTEK